MKLWRDILDMAYKETLHIRRDISTAFFALLLPMMQLTLFGFAIDFDVRQVATVVVDFDQSRESREYVQSLQNTENLRVVAYLSSPDEALERIRRGTARVALVIPPDFSRAEKPQVAVVIDGSDSQVANPARLAVLKPQSDPAVDVRVEMLYNPNNRTEVYTIPGLLGIILQLVTVALTSFSLVREREQGTLEQLMVSPVSRLGLMLGKIAPYFCLAMIELVLVILAARVVFDTPLRGSFLLMWLLSVPFVLAGLSLGLAISTVAQNQAQAMQLTMLTFLPSVLLSGYLAPRETLPLPLHLLSNLIPVTWYIQITRGIMVRGAGMGDLWAPFLGLCTITCVLVAFSTSRFRKSSG
ncbi:MAG: ABC transporter permease [Candidatus Eremiobacteraeota bacterium]|nr:ABC transporter permease [Candidatus Eremiobacteraeota bacterium]